MTTQHKFDLKGLDEYLEAIAKAGRDVDAAADKALLAAAEIIQDGMLAEIEAQGLIDTHNLENHIRIKGPIVDGNFHQVEVGVIHDIAFTDANTARYGNAQEYGYVQDGRHYPARSYIRTGFDKNRKKALAAMKQSLIDDGTL